MSFDHPLWLAILPVAGVVLYVVQRAGISGLSRRRSAVALAVRGVLTALLVLSLAGARLGTGGDRVAVVFLVDRSASVGAAGSDRALEFVRAAVRAKGRGDLAAVVAFGKEPRLEIGMTDHPDVGPITATPDASATDLARALRLGAALFPEGTKRRIVVLTDGRATHGDALREAAHLARDGIVIEGITLTPPTGDDVSIEGLDAPGRVRRGEAYRVVATLSATVQSPAHVTITRDGTTIATKDLLLRPGRTTILADERAEAPGTHRYAAQVDSPADSIPQNDRGTAAVVVEGPPRVLVIEGTPGEATPLVRALQAGQIGVDVRTPAGLPPAADLFQYASTVLVDVPAEALGSDQIASLRTAVSDVGAGLVTLGGENAYGVGGYRGSSLEQLLPVDSEITDPKRRPSVAEAIVIDTSGSMGRCHCRGSGQMGAAPGGIDKTDISRAGAARAIRALSNDDIVGVVAFNTESRWVVPLQKLPPEDVVRHGLAGLTAGGGTNIPQALRSAVADLRLQKTKLKHVILFTDGWTNQSDLVAVAQEVAQAGITLSVVATGEGTGDALSKMADAGHGRFYAGTNLTDVPAVMMQEAILASRNYINEGIFHPVIAASTPLTESLTSSPALLGYVATSPKSAATVELSIGSSNDPLLARWRAGLGTVISWTSDAKARWSKAWVPWIGFRDFWTRVVRSSFAPPGASGFGAEARSVSDHLSVDVAADKPLPPGSTVTARVFDPSLHLTELDLERTSATAFHGDVVAGEEGTYLVGVTVRSASGVLFRQAVTASRAYSAEYLGGGADPSTVPALAKATGGRASIKPQEAFAAGGLKTSRARLELWPILALIAALLLPVDIAVRRLILTRADLVKGAAVARASLTRAGRRRRRAGPREERIERLLEAKRRARER